MKHALTVINAYIHDFASALWLATVLVVYWTTRYQPPAGAEEFFTGFKHDFFIIGLISLAVILVTGVGRTLSYKEGAFGSSSEQKRKEILIIKHVIGFIIYGLGTYWQYTMING
jgi:putative copper export protein